MQTAKSLPACTGIYAGTTISCIKNPAHEDDPWYYEDEVTYPFHTPEYTFQKGSLKRLNYGITHTAPE